MQKIKLTESQILMLQNIQDNRKIKVTESQYNRLFNESSDEGDVSNLKVLKRGDKYFLGRTKFNPSLNKEYPYSKDSGVFDSCEDVCNAYKKGLYSKGLEESQELNEYSSIEIVGEPCENCDVKEYSSPTDRLKRNYKQFNKNLKVEGDDTESSFDGFVSDTKNYLKELLVNPQPYYGTPFFKLLEFFKIIKINDDKSILVMKRNIKNKLRRLYEMVEGDNINEVTPPWDEKPEYDKDREGELGPYKTVFYNDEFALLENEGKLYFFYYEYFERDKFFPYSDAHDIDNLNIDGETITRFVNDNEPSLSKGVGYDSFDKGDDLVLVDNEVKDILLKDYKGGKDYDLLISVLKNIGENTISLGDDVEISEGSKINNPDYKFYIVNRTTKRIYGGNEYREDANEYKDSLLDNNPEEKLAVYTKKFLLSKGINPDDDSNWGDKTDIDEITTAGASGDGGSSGPYVQPKIWAKSKKDHKFSKTPYFGDGNIVDRTIDKVEGIKETSKPGFVSFDDCTKLNNTDTSKSCSQGAVDNVVKISKDKIYTKLSDLTGKSIEEVTNIINKAK